MEHSINKETSTISFASGRELKEEGIKQAIVHAEEKIPKWAEQAYNFLIHFAKRNRVFMVEDVRVSSNGVVPEPPSKRAWGAIIRKALKNGIVEHAGYGKVSNPRAHNATASTWQSEIYVKY